MESIKRESYDEEKIKSSQHSKIKKCFAMLLWGDIHALVKENDFAKAEARKSFDEYWYYKGKSESEAEYHLKCHRAWSDEAHRLDDEIQVKLKAVHKYESSKKMKKPQMTADMNDYMKYGPDDDE